MKDKFYEERNPLNTPPGMDELKNTLKKNTELLKINS